MKTLPSTISSEIANAEFTIFLLVKMEFGTGDIRVTSLPYDVSYDGEVYTSDGGLIKADNPQYTRIVDRESYTLTFSDNADEFKGVFDAGATGADVTVWWSVISSGAPYLTADLPIAYKGKVDEVAYNNDFDQKTAIVKCASALADLDLVKPRYTSKQYQEMINSSDTAFDNIYEGAKEIQIKWGKV